jgi:hypothetical protein
MPVAGVDVLADLVAKVAASMERRVERPTSGSSKVAAGSAIPFDRDRR